MNNTQQIRRFNRFYSAHIGILNKHYLDSNYSLTEVRIMSEIKESKRVTAQEIGDILNLDKGYLSRTLKHLQDNDLITKIRSEKDSRAYFIEITTTGKKLLKCLDQRVDEQISQSIEQLSNNEKSILVNSMDTIKNLLGRSFDKKSIADNITYRCNLKSGDIGYLIYLHGILYEQESGFSLDFEGYVAKTFYDFQECYSPQYDRIWLAEYNNQIVGSVAIVHHSEDEAQLRWFLIHPTFRGTGIGRKILNEAFEFCKDKKFKNIFLVTTDQQKTAIEMYKKLGFKLTKSEKINQWGKTLNDERYDLIL